MNDDVRIALGSLAVEMMQLKGVTIDEDQIDNYTIPFSCKSITVARFLAEMAYALSDEYDNKATWQVILLPDRNQYLLRITANEDVNVEDVILTLASCIDSAMCDAPLMYAIYKGLYPPL